MLLYENRGAKIDEHSAICNKSVIKQHVFMVPLLKSAQSEVRGLKAKDAGVRAFSNRNNDATTLAS